MLTTKTYPARFLVCLAFTLGEEGGYVNDPHDPGGSTNRGVTQVAFNRWLAKHGRKSYDVREISDADLHAFYFEQYWEAGNCASHPIGCDLCVFDFGVNSGIGHIVGQFRNSSVDEICDARQSFLRRLTTYSRFGHGWENRIAACRRTAKRMQIGG